MLSDVIVEGIVGLCTCTCTYKKAMVYYSIVVVYMYKEMFTNNVVSCIKTLSLCRVPCMSVLPILKPELFKLWCENVGVLLLTNCGVLWSKKKLWGCWYVKFIALPSFMCQFC